MKCKKTPVAKKIKPCPPEEGHKSKVEKPKSQERLKYDPGHRMRVRDQDGRTTHRDYEDQDNHKPH
ncbi:MAG: hypothetical protein WC891_04135 [Actinomycetota bacterium]